MADHPPITIADTLAQVRPGQLALSPNGQRYAFVAEAGPADRGTVARSALHIGHVDGPPATPVPGEGRDARPAFAPDGRRVAFLSDRDGSPALQPFLLEPDGRVVPAGRVPGDAEALAWAADGRSLLVLVAGDGADRSGAAGGTRVAVDRQDPRVLRPDQPGRRLHRVDPGTGTVAPVGPSGVTVWEFAWTGRGPALAVVSDGHSENAWYDARLAWIDDDEIRTLHRPGWQIQSPTPSPDGRTAAFVTGYMSDRGQGLGQLTRIDLTTGATATLATPADVQRVRYLPDGRLFWVGQRGLGTACGLTDPNGGTRTLWSGPATLGRVHDHEAAAGPDASVLAPVQAPGTAPEICVLSRPGTSDPRAWRPLTAVNAHLANRTHPHVEHVHWETDDGTSIEGLLLLPQGAAPGPLPLVVWAHGGPNNAWTTAYSPGYHWFGPPTATRGYAVLLPNQRGSTGRGQAFTRAHLGDYGPMDLRDVIAGITDLAGRGVVDPDRVGIIGSSAGGFLAAWAATAGRATFAAAVAMACVANWVSFHNTSNIPRLTEIAFGSDAYDPLGNHVRLSPVMHARGATTPTLVVHGEQDTCTPVGQAQELYQALVSEGCPAELVVYPREGHTIREREHLLDLWERLQTWLDRHLRPCSPTPPGP